MKRLNRRPTEENQEAMMGVGTLIIFIAIILVAAVSAGVFLRTVTLLKQQAEATAEQSVEEVATYLNVRSIYGEADEDRTDIDELKVNLGIGPGSPPQNLDFTLIQVVSREEEETLEYGDYTAEALLDPHDEFDPDTNPIIEPGSTIQLTINVEEFELGPQSELELHFTPKHGTTILESFYTPTVYNRDILPLS